MMLYSQKGVRAVSGGKEPLLTRFRVVARKDNIPTKQNASVLIRANSQRCGTTTSNVSWCKPLMAM